ncbi:MAG TPA: hypothetical protein VFY48_04895 [Solirubrobacterales bacterium]|nr:hypothetical protein [Solirubrobacterales bacterium]
MRRRLHRANPRVAGPLAALLALLAALGPAATASASGRAQAPVAAVSVSEAAAAARVARYWTPQRMRNARPLDLVLGPGGKTRLRVGAAPAAEAAASFLAVSTPDIAPYSFNGRIFIRRGDVSGYCSGTAIDTPTRQLVLTAGHCINSGRENGEPSVWSDYLQFVPAYSGGVAPFGSFVARRSKVFAPRQWTNHGNPDFDLGAFLTLPNGRGENVADAVGGGATIVLDASRHQTFRSFGYPGRVTRLQSCTSPYVGDDLLSNPFPGPPTLGIRCHWAPGASGGGWLIGDGTEINGLNAYLHYRKKSHTYGPYFATETVGRLVRGL